MTTERRCISRGSSPSTRRASASPRGTAGSSPTRSCGRRRSPAHSRGSGQRDGQGPGYTSRFRTSCAELDERASGASPSPSPRARSWPLPLYELPDDRGSRHRAGPAQVRALARNPSRNPSRSSDPPPPRPCGPCSRAPDRVPRRPLRLRGSRRRARSLVPGPSIAAERVVSLPRAARTVLPRPAARPGRLHPHRPPRARRRRDRRLRRGRRDHLPIKQGGVATQQADAVAEVIAARLGRPGRGRALPAGAARTAAHRGRAGVHARRGERRRGPSPVCVHAEPLWWPPSKIAGRWLAPYLAQRHEELGAELAEAGTPRRGAIGLELAGMRSRRVDALRGRRGRRDSACAGTLGRSPRPAVSGGHLRENVTPRRAPTRPSRSRPPGRPVLHADQAEARR